MNFKLFLFFLIEGYLEKTDFFFQNKVSELKFY